MVYKNKTYLLSTVDLLEIGKCCLNESAVFYSPKLQPIFHKFLVPAIRLITRTDMPLKIVKNYHNTNSKKFYIPGSMRWTYENCKDCNSWCYQKYFCLVYKYCEHLIFTKKDNKRTYKNKDESIFIIVLRISLKKIIMGCFDSYLRAVLPLITMSLL